jgi:thiamine biosynthesis protein ThiS
MLDGSCLGDLLRRLELKRGQIVAEVNRNIVHPSSDDHFVLSEGDQVELIQFVGGG